MNTRILRAALVCVVTSAAAQEKAPNPAYQCMDPGNRRLSDQLIVGCKVQYVTDKDGRRLVERALTADEVAAAEKKERDAEEERKARIAQERAERSLSGRFPNEAAHNKARKEALEASAAMMLNLEQRISLLTKERKTLDDELEFYPKGKAPEWLVQKINANDGTIKGTKASLQTQQDDVKRVNGVFDEQLAKLRKLWKAAS